MGYIADLLNESTREAALLELSKKREQVPELALILWHSFGMSLFPTIMRRRCDMLTQGRRHDLPSPRDHFCVHSAQPVTADCCGIEPRL